MFVFLSTLAGLLSFAVAGFIVGYIVGSGPTQSHALSATIVGGLLGLYFSPVGLISGLVGSLVMKNKSAKKMAFVLSICFVITAAASLAYIYLIAMRKG